MSEKQPVSNCTSNEFVGVHSHKHFVFLELLHALRENQNLLCYVMNTNFFIQAVTEIVFKKDDSGVPKTN